MLVNEAHDVVHLSERAGRYLEFGGGEPSQHLLRIVRPELRIELHSALYQAAHLRVPVDARGLQVNLGDRTVRLNLRVRPVVGDDEPARGYFLVLFEEVPDDGTEPVSTAVPVRDGEAARQLEHEMRRIKSQLQAAVERRDTQAEELKASNEELQAMNEELRSSTEELETSKEELQSVNEELRTVNQELKIKVEEQAQAADNIQNLISSSDIGTIFLDRQLRIKLFTPRVRDVFHLIPTDLGRPLSDISSSLLSGELTAVVERVLDRLERVDRELETRPGQWHLMRVVPYRTADDRIDGVVLTFVDITERKHQEDQLRASEEQLRQARSDLERQVTHRTKELASAIGRLDAEVAERRQAEERVRGLLGRLISVQEDERRRIARDLHDHLGQQLAGLRLRVASLHHLEAGGRPVSGEIDQIDTLIGQLDRDLDFFTWELRPPALDDLGIVDALGTFVREWSRNFSIPAQFHSLGLEDGRLRPDIEVSLYRISQEALNNTYKHAHASQVGVVLERRDREVVLVIEDDGVGFDRAALPGGDRALGLTGMSERAVLVGGTLDIETSPGQGTTVFVKVPAMFVGS